jgi:membrane-bound metal-dependent hydrolase YbcI (DUF457 family)
VPSPVGHSFIGLTLGMAWLVPRRRLADWRTWLNQHRGTLLATLLAANACDLDYLPGLFAGSPNLWHRWLGHSAVWAALAGVVIWLLWRRMARAPLPRWALPVILAAALSHVATDYFGDDQRAPFGILACWPFSDRFVLADHPLFLSLHKTALADMFTLHNLRAVAHEILLTLPPLLVVVFYKLRPIRHDAGPTTPA